METLGAVMVVFLSVVFFAAVIAGFFMWVGAKLSAVPGATFGKAVVAGALAAIVTCIARLVFSILPLVGGVLGSIAGLLCAILVIKVIFETSTGRAIVVWVLCALGLFIAWRITMVVFAGSVAAAGL